MTSGEHLLNVFGGSGDVHGSRKGVVRRLRHVDVVVGMHGLLGADVAAGELDGPVRDDLVDVHVGLRAAAGLPDVEREMVAELAGDHFVGRVRRSNPLRPFSV